MGPIIEAAIGGLLIGIAGAGLLLLHGKVAGISGMLYGIVNPQRGDVAWKGTFLLGMISVGAAAAIMSPELVAHDVDRSLGALVVAGLLVGFGTRLGGGCTSGHAVCGVAALSRRSIVATVTFLTVGAATVYVVQNFFGGVL